MNVDWLFLFLPKHRLIFKSNYKLLTWEILVAYIRVYGSSAFQYALYPRWKEGQYYLRVKVYISVGFLHISELNKF